LAKEIWNQYYAPVFDIKDEPILAIYSHMISYPLYLSAYSFGQIIEYQLEQYLIGKDFAKEVDRIYRLGRLTPNQWMIQATGRPLSVAPLLEAVKSYKND
jgi:oligoendopeptidase F